MSEVISSVITDKKFQIEVRPSPRKVIFGTETTIEQQNTAASGRAARQSTAASHASRPPHKTEKPPQIETNPGNGTTATG